MRCFLGLLLLSVLAVCCTRVSKRLEQTDMVHDLRKVTRALVDGHPAVGRTVTAADLLAMRDSIIAALPDTATRLDFARRLKPLLDTLRGGHVGLYPHPSKQYFGSSATHILPLTLKRIPSAAYVVRNVTHPLDSSWIGREVLTLADRPVDAWVDEARTFTAGSDGGNRTGAVDRAVQRLPQHLNYVLSYPDSIAVGFRDTVWNLPLRSLAVLDSLRKTKPKRAPRRPLAYGYDTLRHVAILDVNSFSGYDPLNLRWPAVLNRVFAKAARDSARGLVLDLRSNGGGRSANIQHLLSYLVSAPTPLYGPWTYPRSGWRHASLVNRALLGPNALFGKRPQRRFGRLMRHRIRPSRRHQFTGPVVVLINSGTFSAASVSAAVLKSSQRALLLGEEAGGNYRETYAGLFSTIPLRRTGLRMRLPHLLIPVDVDSARHPPVAPLQPDVVLPHSRAALLDGQDAWLLAALIQASEL